MGRKFPHLSFESHTLRSLGVLFLHSAILSFHVHEYPAHAFLRRFSNACCKIRDYKSVNCGMLFQYYDVTERQPMFWDAFCRFYQKILKNLCSEFAVAFSGVNPAYPQTAGLIGWKNRNHNTSVDLFDTNL